MSKTRNNHYVPQWYQEGFFEPGRNTLAYLDLKPPQKVLEDGRVITQRAQFEAPTSRAFYQRDLYSMFFGASVNDEIERRLFGDIDTRGSKAVRAFVRTDVSEQHRYFQSFFEYIDIQKTRTPKGLDWLKAQYPSLTQNELMMEMQGIQMMHCTLWTEGVREIISAEDADVKFIVSDHPVTIYNHAISPKESTCRYPNDPSIALKASQTVFPLTRNFCLVLTNLEYAKNPAANPLEKRTFARNYRTSMVRTDAFIRTRKFSNAEVVRINYLLKARARRYIAAGRKEWLFPENSVSESWGELRQTLLPPKDQLWHFGGELFAKFKDGHVHYQDAFGRTEEERKFLKKDVPAKPLRPNNLCGCGSGRAFKDCCKPRPPTLRPTWSEKSIRERNFMLYNAIVNVLGLKQGKDWLKIRRELTDEKISRIYALYHGLWPLETDLLRLLPKPDGVARAVYTGVIHPEAMTEFVLGAPLYFGELLITHPFTHPMALKKEINPVRNPKSFRREFLKSVVFFLDMMPLVDCGLVNLIPDPCDFDPHLRDQMMNMAKARTSMFTFDPSEDPRLEGVVRREFMRTLLLMSRDALKAQFAEKPVELKGLSLEEFLQGIERIKERDPLAVLQDGSLGGQTGGQYSFMKLAPNFEMAMYLAQATGSCIVTDSIFRWREIMTTVLRRSGNSTALEPLARSIKGSNFTFLRDAEDTRALASSRDLAAYPALMRDTFKYLSGLNSRGPKPNFEKQLSARFARTHSAAQATIRREARFAVKEARLSCAFPSDGIQDNTINRLLLMSSSEHDLPNVPMAFFIEGQPSRKPISGLATG